MFASAQWSEQSENIHEIALCEGCTVILYLQTQTHQLQAPRNQAQLELKISLGTGEHPVSYPQLVFPLTTSYKCDDAALMIAAQAKTRLDDPRRACVQATKWQYSLPAFNSHIAMGWLRVNKWRREDHGHIYLPDNSRIPGKEMHPRW